MAGPSYARAERVRGPWKGPDGETYEIVARRPGLQEVCALDELLAVTMTREGGKPKFDPEALKLAFSYAWGLVETIGGDPPAPVEKAAAWCDRIDPITDLAVLLKSGGELTRDERGESDAPSKSKSAAPSTSAASAPTSNGGSFGAATRSESATTTSH